MARQVAEQLRPHPGKELLEELKQFVAPKITQINERLESPDTKGKSEAYFATLSRPERKKFLIAEMSEAAISLTQLSYDLELNLTFYNTAPDKIVKNRLRRFFFPERARKENSLQKVTRATKEMVTGRLTPPNRASKDGASERWRRRVLRGIDIFLEERRVVKKIEAAWNDPEEISRNEFRAAILFNKDLKHPSEAVFTPLGMILILEDDDYDVVVDDHLLGKDNPSRNSSFGVALTEHEILPALGGRVTLVRRSENDLKKRDAYIRHELFHLYFQRFIRQEKLSKVQPHIIEPDSLQTVSQAQQLIADTTTNLESNILEETCAYLFNNDLGIDTDRAHGFAWEQILLAIKEHLGPNVTPEELRGLIRELRTAQASYLQRSRSLQLQIGYLFDYFSQDTLNEDDDERTRRSLLFLLSQWGPSRMDQFAERLGIEKKMIAKEEAHHQTGLQKDLQVLVKDLQAGKSNESKTHQLLFDVVNEVSWMYAEHSLVDLTQLCSFMIENNGDLDYLYSLLRSLENTIVVRQTPLSQDEVTVITHLTNKLKAGRNKKFHRHAGILKRIRNEFALLES